MNPLWTYIFRRLALMVPTIFGILLIPVLIGIGFIEGQVARPLINLAAICFVLLVQVIFSSTRIRKYRRVPQAISA